jgi:hypothetical protein
MPCAYNASTSIIIIPNAARVGLKRLGFLRAIVNSFQEAKEMRRAAYRSYRLTDE